MKCTITKQHENVLLGRTEVQCDLTFDKATPSNNEVSHSVATSLKAPLPHIVVKKISVRYGSNNAQALVHVYQSVEQLNKAVAFGRKALEKIKKVEEEAKKAAEEVKKAKEAAKAEPA